MANRQSKDIKIKVQSCLFKSKCRHCCSTPKSLYFMLNKTADFKHFVKKNIFERLDLFFDLKKKYDFNLAMKNRNITSILLFDDITLSLLKSSAKNIYYNQNKDKLVYILECHCGKTRWSFMQSEREHIKNRKPNEASFVKSAFGNSKSFSGI